MNYLNSLVTKPDIEIIIDEIDNRKKHSFKDLQNKQVRLPTFYDREDICGKVVISVKSNKFEHQGIKIELIGLIDNVTDKKLSSKFITLTRDLEAPSTITNEVSTYNFRFNNVEKQYETYNGISMKVRYILQATVLTKTRTHMQEIEFGVINPVMNKISNTSSIKLEVGIDEWLHLIFEVNRNKYHLKDCIEGSVRFKKCSLRLTSMEVQILRKETILGQNTKTDTDIIARYELMDGAPIRNETIPIKMFLSPYSLTPSYPDINSRLQVNYYLNIVLTDLEDRRYFKQHLVEFIRLDKKIIKSGYIDHQ